MPDWKSLLYKVANRSETSFDRFKLQFRQRMGWTTDIQICPYITYGHHSQILLRGRVLHDRGLKTEDRDTVWENLVNMYKRFSSNEIAGASLKISFNGTVSDIISDEDGYFETTLSLQPALPAEELWHHPLIELTKSPVPFTLPVQARARVMTPPSTAKFGIISDIDDTVLPTHAQSLLKSAYMTFLNNAHTRLPFQGVAAFYKALQTGVSGAEYNPIFYVSSSPWNLYDLLFDFMTVNGIPHGPLLLKDYGFTHKKLFSESHEAHKVKSIQNILDAYPTLSFILIGDSGQHDPEIYDKVIKLYPGRILASYIRDVSVEERDLEVKKISGELSSHKVEMVLAENSYTAAKHAAEKGFIKPDMLSIIKEEKELDKAGEDLSK
jgi:phosphatidate phosphatase APP1